jgi:hypothetical protein
MNKSLNKVEKNYLDHPAFPNFGKDVPEAVLRQIETFNTNYIFLRDYGGLVSNAENLEQELFQVLNNIFEWLVQSDPDKYFQLFVRELWSYCTPCLRDEVNWFLRKRRKFRLNYDASSAIAPSNEMNKILNLAHSDIQKFRDNIKNGRLRRDDLSLSSGQSIARIIRILNKEFSNIGVLDAVSVYCGVKMEVIGAALELSVPSSGWWKNSIPGLARPPKTLYAHFDETVSKPKAILYLTDVEKKNGPTSCYPGFYNKLQLPPLAHLIGRLVCQVGANDKSKLFSYYNTQYHQAMASEKFRRHFMMLPSEIRFNSHFGWDVAPDSDLEDDLVGKEKFILGKRGHLVAFDGAKLLHRGGMLETGERLALQIIFGQSSAKRSLISLVRSFF